MRLVLEYHVGDGCTYSCTNTLPFEYESAEAALVDLEDAVLKRVAGVGPGNWSDVIQFAGHSLEAGDFMENGKFWPPQIMTIDEWFEQGSMS